MNSLCLVMIMGFVLVLLVSGTVSAFASVEFNSYVPINGYRITPTFKFSKTILIDYPDGGKIQNELSGKAFAVEFFGDSDNNTSIKSFMQQLNTQIGSGKKNPISLVDLSMTYQAIVRGNDKQASIDYVVTLKPIFVNYVLGQVDANAPSMLDMSWMGLDVKEPITIATIPYGDMEINFPLGLMQNQLPAVYDILKGTPAEDVLNKNLINSMSLVDYPIEKWDVLYDPAYVLNEDAGPEYAGQKAAVTAFAYGQNNLNQELPKLAKTIDFTTDAKYSITITEKPSSGTIDVEGQAKGSTIQGMPVISTSMFPVHAGAIVTGPWWSGTQGVILWFAVAGSGMIIFWALYFARFKE